MCNWKAELKLIRLCRTNLSDFRIPRSPDDLIALLSPSFKYPGFEFLLCKNCKTGVISYQLIHSIGGIRHRVPPGRDPTAKPLAVGDILCATAPCYRCLIENQAALRTRSGGRKAARPACLQNGRLPPVNRFRRPGLFRSLPSDIAIRNKQCPNRADRFTAHH